MSVAALTDARVRPGRVNPERWIVAGVAADLARTLRAPVHLIRPLLLVGAFFQPTGVLVAYTITAALLPRGEHRRPSWASGVALGRIALLLMAPIAMTAGGVATDDLLSSGPALWVPICAVTLAIVLVVLASGPVAGEIDEAHCRTLVLGSLGVLALAAAAVAGMALAPGVRWDRVLPLLVIAAGAGLALRGAPATVVPVALLAGATLLLASAGARLQGGVGALDVTPRSAEDVVARRALGDVHVNLLAVTGPEVTVRASAGVGDVRILVPDGAVVDGEIHTGRGSLRPGPLEAGFDLHRRLHGRAGRGVHVWIVAEAGLGDVEVVRPGGAS